MKAKIELDPIFNDPRLAALYDAFEGNRNDLVHYVKINKDLKARNVIDLGCGTGSLALMLAKEKIQTIGVDPAQASLDEARKKKGSENVEWIMGDASALPLNVADAVVMVGNVAQAIVEPEQWDNTLCKIYSALKPGGHLIFETRIPEVEAWTRWNKQDSFKAVLIPKTGVVVGYVELIKVNLPLVSFRWSYFFRENGETLVSDSTLRFRSLAEIKSDLSKRNFEVLEVREAPDRPGQEYVVIARSLQNSWSERTEF